jgi:hypothetical protein
MLNDPTWVEAARVLAERLMHESEDVSRQLTSAAERVLCRRITDSEMTILRRAYDKQLAIYRGDAAAGEALLSVGQSQRDGQLSVPEHAALTQTCLGLFNLDEALTRE